MKTIVCLFSLLFISYLATPTLVGILEANADVSLVFATAEEEVQKDVKAWLNVPFESNLNPREIQFSTNCIDTYYNACEQLNCKNIFSPPPEYLMT